MKFQDLIAKAKADPKFFHDLVFYPERVAESTDDPDLKAAIRGVSVNAIFGQLARNLGLQWCGNTCGASSCIDTCGARSCDNTCADSCGNTCSHSCGDTTKIQLGRGAEIRF
jgi:hypothetical protein